MAGRVGAKTGTMKQVCSAVCKAGRVGSWGWQNLEHLLPINVGREGTGGGRRMWECAEPVWPPAEVIYTEPSVYPGDTEAVNGHGGAESRAKEMKLAGGCRRSKVRVAFTEPA